MADQDDNKQLFAAAQECFKSNAYIKASKLLQRLLTRNTTNAQAHHWLGKSLSRRTRYVEAITQFEEAIKRGFDNADVHIELANAFLAQAKNEKELASVGQQKSVLALAEFDRAIAAEQTRVAGPSRVEASLAAGKACMEMAKTDKARYHNALTYFDAAIAADPTRIEARLEAGRACLKEADSDKTQYERALTYFDAAIAADPTRIEARLEAGRACLKEADSDKTQYERALTYFDAAIAADPTRIEARLEAGRACLKKADSDKTQYERALTYFDAALRQAPGSDVCYALEAVVPQLTDQETVLSRWRKIVQRHKHLDAHLQFGRMLWALDKPELALEQLLAAACQLESSTQESVDIRWSFQPFLSSLRSDPKIVADTRSILTKAQRSLQKARDPRAHALWAYGLSLVGLIHPAMNHWQQALEQAPADARCHELLRDVLDERRLMRSDQFAELLAKIQAIVDASSEPLAYLEWGRTQSLLGNHDDAGRDFERSDLPDGYAEWGSLLMAEGNADLAKEKLLHAFDLAERTGNINALISHYQHLLSRVLLKAKDPSRLIDRIDAVVGHSTRPHLLRWWADRLIKLERYREAFDCCTVWRKLEPENAEAFHKLGQIHSARGEFAESIDAFKKAIEVDPTSYETHKTWLQVIGECDLKAGAVAKLVKAFGGWGDGLDTTVNWQEVERLREMSVQTVRELLEEVEAYVDDSSIYTDIVPLLHQRGMIDEALRLLARTHRHLPEIINAYLSYYWGRLFEDRGEYKRAIIKLRRATALSPSWYYPYRELARCYEDTQQYRLASLAYERALRKGTYFGNADEAQLKAEAYTAWARVLSNAGEYDKALEKSRLALEFKPSNYWGHFYRAFILSDMLLHEQALAEYDLATQNGPFPHAHHNMADLFERQGSYSQAKQKYTETRNIYQRDIAAKLRERDADFCLYYSWAYPVDHNERKAEDLMRAAIMFNSCNPEFQVSLAKLYLNRTKTEAQLLARANGNRVANAAASAVPARLKAIEHYRKAEQLLNQRLGFHRTADRLLDLGELQLLNEEWDKAKTAFEEAIRMDPDSIRGRKGLAETHLKLGDAAAAVRHLKIAVKLAPVDLSVLLLHAQACRRAEQLEDAEGGYQKVLQIAQFHVDAMVGLGELYLDMAEKRASQKNSTAVAELYTKAISSLDRAIKLFDAVDAPLTIASNPASTCYLLGYAQVQLYETSVLRRDKGLIASALKNFNACLVRDKFHVKAKRAIESIKEDRRAAKTRLERYAAPAIIVMAFFVFVLAQFALVIGRPVHAQDIMLTPASLAGAKAAGLSDDLLHKLKPVENIPFRTGEKLAAKAKELIGSENFSKFSTSLIEPAERKKGEPGFEPIDLGSYAFLTLGSLLVMMAGAYLPQLTSLKLPGLQLEKASAERIETKTTLAIEK